jgi:hypothetical protein
MRAVAQVLLVLLACCAAVDAAQAATPNDSLFTYNKDAVAVTLTKLEDHAGYELLRLSYPAHNAKDLVNPTVDGWYYRQKTRHPRPGIVQIPILGGDYEPEKMFAEGYARQGFHVVLLERKALLLSPAEGLERTRQVLIDSVIDLRRALDWWTAQPELDARRVGVSGISMGGFLGSLWMAVDDRPAAGVFLLNGCDWPSLLQRTSEYEVIVFREMTMRMQGLNDESFAPYAHRWLDDVDPLTWAPRLRGRPILYFSARFDWVVPFDLASRWWEAAGRPRRILLPTGHYGAGVFADYVHKQCVKHFRRAFGMAVD